jgi:hypothetical protein
MNTDRELLELAAKAAGFVITWGEKYMVGPDEVDCTDLPYVASNSPDVAPEYWNPLEDDGDAMRLLVKLASESTGFALWLSNSGVTVNAPLGPSLDVEEEAEDHDGDLSAAVRRSIVRAAADIERAK